MSGPGDTTVEKAIEEALAAAEERGWVQLGPRAGEKVVDLVRELLKWNRVYNLTAITAPKEVAELHVLDSLAVAPLVAEGESALDVGTGAGFPGLPVAIVRPVTRWTLIDRTEKKVAFVKAVAARLGLDNVRAVHLRLEGDPEGEGLGRFDVVVSRAFAAPEVWLPFAAHYVRPGGRVVAMLGAQDGDLGVLAAELGVAPETLRVIRYELPSGARRGLLVWTR